MKHLSCMTTPRCCDIQLPEDPEGAASVFNIIITQLVLTLYERHAHFSALPLCLNITSIHNIGPIQHSSCTSQSRPIIVVTSGLGYTFGSCVDSVSCCAWDDCASPEAHPVDTSSPSGHDAWSSRSGDSTKPWNSGHDANSLSTYNTEDRV